MKKITIVMLLAIFFSGGVSLAQTQSSSTSNNVLRYPQIHFPSQMPPPLSTPSKNSHQVKITKKPLIKKQISAKKKPLPKSKKSSKIKPTPSIDPVK